MTGLYHTTDIDGITELKPDKQRLRVILSSLDGEEADDANHPDVSLVNDDNGWSLSVYASGIVTLDHLDAADAPPLFMKNVTRDAALGLWLSLAAGQMDALHALPWQKSDEA